MPKDPISKKAMEKPDGAVREAERSEEFRDEDTQGPRRRARKLRKSLDPPGVNNAAGLGHLRRPRERLADQPDLYERLWSVADGPPRQVRPSRRKSTVRVRCPLCGCEIDVAAIALTMECPGCHAIVDALEVARAVAPPPGRPLSAVPTQTESKWRAAEPILPEALPSFLIRPVPITAEALTARTLTSRSHMVPMVLVTLGVIVLLGAVAGASYWRVNPQQGQAEPEVATFFETSPNGTLPVPTTVPPRLTRLVVGLPLLGDQPRADEPPTAPVAAPPVTALDAEATGPVPMALAPQALAAAKPVAAPPDDVFVVRFDSKLPGLTPSGLRALDAALRVANKGRKVRIEIDGCVGHDNMPTDIDCAALTRSLKRILADHGVDHPADLIASLYPPISVPATPPVSGQTTTSSVVAQSPAPAPAAEAPPPARPLSSPAPPAKTHRRAANRQPSPVANPIRPIGFEF
jgi:hypothetical protein